MQVLRAVRLQGRNAGFFNAPPKGNDMRIGTPPQAFHAVAGNPYVVLKAAEALGCRSRPFVRPFGLVANVRRDDGKRRFRHVVKVDAVTHGEGDECPRTTAVTHSKFQYLAHLALSFGDGFHWDAEGLGICEFVKIGASTTFLKKKNWVETITSTSMPMGILPEVDYECTRKKMEDGDYIIMVSDGVMDAFPQPDAEERIKDYLLETDMENVKALAKALLKYVLEAGTAPARDDMTVLVGALRRR